MNIDRVLPGDAPLPTREEAQELVLSIMAQLREEAGPLYADLLRYFLLEELDRGWKEHLRNMDFLRDGIGLRGYGQRDPKLEYKREASTCSRNCLCTIREGAFRALTRVRVEQRPTEVAEEVVAAPEPEPMFQHKEQPQQLPTPTNPKICSGLPLRPKREQAGPQRSLSLRQRQKVQEVLRREREIVKAVLGRGECSEKGSPSLKIASEGTALPPQGFCRGSLCGD